MLTIANTVLVIVDVQEKLTAVIHDRDVVKAGILKIIRGTKILQIPQILVEQNPDRMGLTIPEIRNLLSNLPPIAKLSFSCAGEPQFMNALHQTGRRQVLLTGIETHVCIAQTAADLVAAGYEVEVLADAVGSRSPGNKEIGLTKAKAHGAYVSSIETALFEMLRTAAHPSFREILALVK